jgi:hypothetical protein
LNPVEKLNGQTPIYNPEDDTQDIPVPSFNDICFIINKLKCNKSAGSDNLSPELIKNGGRSLKQKLHKLILNVWETGKLPAQWTEGIICPIYKKGDRLI